MPSPHGKSGNETTFSKKTRLMNTGPAEKVSTEVSIPGIIACVTYIRSLFSGGHGTRLTMNVLCIYIDD